MTLVRTTRLLLPLLTALLALSTGADARIMWVGRDAPEFSIDRLLNAPPGTPLTLAEYKGSAVVIEFFSVECPKCQEAMPHFNELAREMKNDPITFFALSNEDESLVRQFMRSNPMSAYVGLDTDWTMWRDYFVVGIPLAVVINPNGVIAAVTHPNDLNRSMLLDVINGKTPDARLTELLINPSAPTSQSNRAIPLMKVEVQPAKTSARMAMWKGEEFRARAITLAELLSLTLNIPAHLIVSDDLLLDARYDVTISPPKPDAKLVDDLLRSVVEQMVSPRIKKTQREIGVYVLRARPAGAMKLTPGGDATPELKATDGSVVATNVPLDQIVVNLQRDLRVPVIDETGLTGGFSFELKWDAKNPASVATALREQLGLDVRIEPRLMDVYLIKRGD